MKKDKVTVVTPTWNSAKYIRETIKSVQEQTYRNWEMVIVDDCSTDNTVEVIKEIAKADSRIRLIEQKQNQHLYRLLLHLLLQLLQD